MKSYSVLIPTCNGLETIQQCIISAAMQTMKPRAIIVYENNSQVPLVESKSFAKAFGFCASKGIKLEYHFAIYREGKLEIPKIRDDAQALVEDEYTFLLDDDVVLEPTAVAECFSALGKTFDFAQCKVQDCNGARGHSDYSYFPSEAFINTTHGIPEGYEFHEARANDFDASCVLVKTSVLKENKWDDLVGGHYDYEDLMYSKLLVKKGYKGVLALESLAWHWFRSSTWGRDRDAFRAALVDNLLK